MGLMKTKKEIEQLADEQFEKGNIYEYELGFIKGYTQCQEDMANEKYDIGDFLNMIEEFKEKELPNRNVPYHYEAEIEAGLKHFEIFIKGKIIS